MPQGSVLGPLLFNIYVNDVVKINNEVSFFLYADDTSLFISGQNPNELAAKAQKALSIIYDWSLSNSLKINAKKTKAILFGAKNKDTTMKQLITLGGAPVEIVNKHKILGVRFSSDLTWTSHIEALAKSLLSAAGALARCRHYFPVKTTIQIYHALFAAHLHYCTLIWGTTTIGNIEKLFLLQKRALRYIANVPYSHSTPSLFSQIHVCQVYL